MQGKGRQGFTRTLLSVVCLLSAVLRTPQAHANDMVLVGSGGGWRPLKAEHRSIRMVSEKVAIEVADTSYLVTADFVFHNQGRATTVAMGFPETGQGDITPAAYEHESGFKSFKTFVDGTPTDVRRVVLPHASEDYSALWVKHVHFSPGQTRRVRVRYRSEAGEFSDGSQIIGYQFTGGNWSGDVAESVLTLHFHAQKPGAYVYNTSLDAQNAEDGSPQRNIHQTNVLRRKDPDTLVLKRTHWQAQADFEFNFVHLPPNWMDSGNLSLTPDTALSQFTIPFKANDNGDGRLFPQTSLGIQKGGTTFVNLQLLQSSLEESLVRGNGSKVLLGPPQTRMKMTWNARDNSLMIAAKQRHLLFWANKSSALRQDGVMVPLGARPFRVIHHGVAEWYVPLQPILTLLGATAEIKPQQHLLRVVFPKA